MADRSRGSVPFTKPNPGRPATGVVADPRRGTWVALGFTALAALAVLAWARSAGWGIGCSPAAVAGLIALTSFAERITVQIGPRTWYTFSSPTIVLAGLIGGPLVGAAAGISSQLFRTEAVWRQRLTEGGLASLQGLAAGTVGLLATRDPGRVTAVVGLAVALSTALNMIGRLLIMIERRSHPLVPLWVRTLRIDSIEAVLLVPLLTGLVLSSKESLGVTLASVAALLVSLSMAERVWQGYLAELASEQENARRDRLTGAPNRRAFEEALAAEHARIVRGGRPAGLFVIDIDRFKSINDAHGHGVGDEVLVAVFRRLNEGLRASDVVARWGGEEITVLAPDADSARALEQFAERIRRLVSDEPVVVGDVALDVTVSVGGTQLDGSVLPDTALRRADSALYDAKQYRNRAVVDVPPVPLFQLGAA